MSDPAQTPDSSPVTWTDPARHLAFDRWLGGIAAAQGLLIDPAQAGWATDKRVQVLAGALVVAVIVLGDVPTGLILGLALLVLTARVNAHALGIDLSAWARLDFGKSSGGSGDLLRAYVTPKNLHDAQSNRVDERDDEVKGFEGVYGEPWLKGKFK